MNYVNKDERGKAQSLHHNSLCLCLVVVGSHYRCVFELKLLYSVSYFNKNLCAHPRENTEWGVYVLLGIRRIAVLKQRKRRRLQVDSQDVPLWRVTLRRSNLIRRTQARSIQIGRVRAPRAPIAAHEQWCTGKDTIRTVISQDSDLAIMRSLKPSVRACMHESCCVCVITMCMCSLVVINS